MAKIYIMFFAMAFILSITAAGYKVWTNMQNTITALSAQNAQLEGAVDTQKDTISAMETNAKKANEELTRVNQEFTKIRSQNDELSKKLEKHDLGILAANKPGLTEKVINKATEKAGRCFELLSGAELTDNELGAKDGKSFNSECPWLFNPVNTP